MRPFLAASALLFAGCLHCPQARGPVPPPALDNAHALVTARLDSLFTAYQFGVSREGEYTVFAGGVDQRFDASGTLLSQPRSTDAATLFDLASVTKVMATTMAVMLLVDQGYVDVEAPVSHYLPAFSGPRLDSITVEHLLRHTSGLAQWLPFYYQASTSEETFARIRAMPLPWGVGEGRHYSDLGFMVLGYLVERVSGQPLDAYVREHLYEPLGLHSTAFRPRTRGFTHFAATETGNAYERQMVYDSTFGYRVPFDPLSWNSWRTDVLVGETNDGNAFYAHGGVAGHAGLFSTASDLLVLVDLLLDDGVHEGTRYLQKATIDRFLTPGADGHFLGWQHPEGSPPGTFAHTGFTGTYVAGVPAHGLGVVLLTNRQHAGRDTAGQFPDLRPLQRAVLTTLLDARVSRWASPSGPR